MTDRYFVLRIRVLRLITALSALQEKSNRRLNIYDVLRTWVLLGVLDELDSVVVGTHELDIFIGLKLLRVRVRAELKILEELLLHELLREFF